MTTELMHHGILGQHWGVRRFQKDNGSYTNAGKKRYLSKNSKTKKSGRRTKKHSGIDAKKVLLGAALIGGGAFLAHETLKVSSLTRGSKSYAESLEIIKKYGSERIASGIKVAKTTKEKVKALDSKEIKRLGKDAITKTMTVAKTTLKAATPVAKKAAKTTLKVATPVAKKTASTLNKSIKIATPIAKKGVSKIASKARDIAFDKKKREKILGVALDGAVISGTLAGASYIKRRTSGSRFRR